MNILKKLFNICILHNRNKCNKRLDVLILLMYNKLFNSNNLNMKSNINNKKEMRL